MCVCVCVCVTERERQRQRETETERDREKKRDSPFSSLHDYVNASVYHASCPPGTDVHPVCGLLTGVRSSVLQDVAGTPHHGQQETGQNRECSLAIPPVMGIMGAARSLMTTTWGACIVTGVTLTAIGLVL